MKKLKKNPILEHFTNNKLIKSTNIFYKGTRDIEEINVLIDQNSGSLILDKCIEDPTEYYNNNEIYSSDKNNTLIDDHIVSTIPIADDIRRVEMFSKILNDKKILDFGCGNGGFLRRLNDENISNKLFGLELNRKNRENINNYGINCLETINESINELDFIFLNHVFEHLDDPFSILKKLFPLLKKDGHLIIEIPHGDDFLIKDCNLDSFKKFTFWSEHICLYTKPLIDRVFSHLKNKNYEVSYFQRYGMNNHHYWIKENKPGGHVKCKIFTDSINKSYKKHLVKEKKSDTMFIVVGPNRSKISNLIINF